MKNGYLTGIDIVDIKRIKRLMKDKAFLKRVFTERELLSCLRGRRPEARVAEAFAAKEAFLKAIGTGLGKGIGWKDMEVSIGAGVGPGIIAKGRASVMLGKREARVSASSAGAFAVAIVVIGERTGQN